jgi:hypothetical protein
LGKMDKMKQILLCITILGLLLSLTACAGAGKATTPAEVVDRVKVGMTVEEVLDKVDQDYFMENYAYVSIDLSELGAIEGIPDYQDVFVWFYFGKILQSVDPAAVAIRGDTVVAVGRLSFDEAQRLIEWQTGIPFGR